MAILGVVVRAFVGAAMRTFVALLGLLIGLYLYIAGDGHALAGARIKDALARLREIARALDFG